MRSIKTFLLILMFLPVSSAFGEDHPATFKDGILTIPSVNTDEQVGKYQDGVFKLTDQGTWELVDYKTMDSIRLRLAPVDTVEVMTIYSFPIQVLLRVSGTFPGCGNLGQISHRLKGNQFDIVVSDDYYPSETACLQGLFHFKKTIPLPVYGLSAGNYSYSVNGLTGIFSLPVDNSFPGDCNGTIEPCSGS